VAKEFRSRGLTNLSDTPQLQLAHGQEWATLREMTTSSVVLRDPRSELNIATRTWARARWQASKSQNFMASTGDGSQQLWALLQNNLNKSEPDWAVRRGMARFLLPALTDTLEFQRTPTRQPKVADKKEGIEMRCCLEDEGGEPRLRTIHLLLACQATEVVKERHECNRKLHRLGATGDTLLRSVSQLTGLPSEDDKAAATACLLGAFDENDAMKALAACEEPDSPPDGAGEARPEPDDELKRATEERRRKTVSSIRWALLTHAYRINELHLQALKARDSNRVMSV
jgi:hypothetical protein